MADILPTVEGDSGPKEAVPVILVTPDGSLSSQISPPSYHQTLTPDDGTDLDPIPSNLIVTVSGDVELVDSAGTSVTYSGWPVGILPFRPARLGEATTATVVAWYHSDPAP